MPTADVNATPDHPELREAAAAQDWPKVATLLTNDTSVTELKIKGCGMNAAGAAALAKALEKNDTLTTLDISSNEIKDAGATSLFAALEKNKRLTTLNIGANRVGDETAKAFASLLEKNVRLTTLYMYGNKDMDPYYDNIITPAGGAALGPALEKNSTLTTLDISHQMIGPEGAAALAGALGKEKNQTLTTLFCQDNKIREAGAESFEAALKNGAMLHTFACYP